MAELWNDIVYTDVMQSDGYVVDYGIFTTYSLDMSTLLSIPFMLGTMTELTEIAMRSPHLVLEAVNKSTDKFAVFCNAGCIVVPQANSKIYTLLENNVIQIKLPAKGAGFVNFHPKLWVIKEHNPDTGKRQIKIVVLSRNLTCSNDIDVACELIGQVGTEPSSDEAKIKHRPLVTFLEWLADKSLSNGIRNKIRRIIKDLNTVEYFDLKDSPFVDYAFFPMGITGYDGLEDCLKTDMLDHAADMVVISPFIDRKTLALMSCSSSKSRKTLITRHASITDEILRLFNDNGGVYVPKEVLTDKVEKDVTVDLHEKVYFIHNSKTNVNHLYLGSTNATQNGFGRNVEFLLKLSFDGHKTSYDKFRNELINDRKDCIFEQITAVSMDKSTEENPLEELMLRQTIDAISNADVQKQIDGYCVTIKCKKDKLPKTVVKIYPLGCESKECILTDNVMFKNLELAVLTEFYVLSIENIRRVVKIETTGIPIDERDRAIFKSMVDTKGKFISYIAFMLTDDTDQYILENHQMVKELMNMTSTVKEQEMSVSLYEDMVRMAYTNPERIVAIRSVIEKADESVIPEHFMELYASFENVKRQINRLCARR